VKSLKLLAWLLLNCGTLAAQVIADFESGSTSSLRPSNATAQTLSDGAAQGQRYLHLAAATTQPARALVRLNVPKDIDFSRRQSLSAQLRAPRTKTAIELRWLALDEKGRPIFQRRFNLEPGEKWIQLDQPLRVWRWDNRFIGDWSEVREIALRIETPSAQVDVDDIRLKDEPPPDERAKWLLELAFEKRPTRFLLEDQMLVASDVVDAFGNSELSRLLQDMKQVRAFIRSAFKNVVRPTESDGTLALLIFKDTAEQRAFIERLSEQWQADISFPQAAGYTVQDIATSTYLKDLGPRRPVYIHEATHAIVARDLRLQVGHPPHTPLHEGLASYVQACVHPKSLDRRLLIGAFAKQIDPQSREFKPLDKLFGARATLADYPQLATTIAYLLENDPRLLDSLIQGIADGQSADSVVQMSGTTWQRVQEQWQAWGRKRYAAGTEGQAPFDPPPQLR
jgi:hypothetical protein